MIATVVIRNQFREYSVLVSFDLTSWTASVIVISGNTSSFGFNTGFQINAQLRKVEFAKIKSSELRTVVKVAPWLRSVKEILKTKDNSMLKNRFEKI